MRTYLTRAGLIVAATTSLVVGLSACGGDSDADDPAAGGQEGAVGVVEKRPGDGGPPTTIDAGQGGYRFGVDRESIASAIQTTYESDNAEVTWEGDTLVLAMDGDASAPSAGFQECRVITQMINDSDEAAIEYPNGRIECTELLGE